MCQLELQSFEIWLVLDDPLPRWLTHMAVGWQPQFLITSASPMLCLKVLTTWQLAASRVNDPRESKREGSNSAFYDPVWEVTHCLSLVKSKSRSPACIQREEKLSSPFWREICQNICGCVLKVTLYKVNPSIYTQRHHSSNFPLSPIPSTFTSLFDHHHYCGNILLFSHLKKNFLQIHCNSFTPLHKTPQRSWR